MIKHARLAVTLAVAGVTAASLATPAAATGRAYKPTPSSESTTCLPLPLGDPDLPQSCSTQELARGVTYTRIVRGDTPAAPGEIDTTNAGPWIINAVTIDPRKAKGHLEVARGQHITDRATVSQLVARVGGLVGVNASFFDLDNNSGEPTGLAIKDGQLVSEPCPPSSVCRAPYTPPADEWGGILTEGAIINEATNKLLLNTFTWAGTIRNVKTKKSLTLTNVDASPVVPAECASLVDQTRCAVPGRLVRIDTGWGPQTPAGPGIEVVLDKRGCVVSTATTRGTALEPGQTSLQATGNDTVALLDLAQGGCITTDLRVFENGRQVHLTPKTQAVSAWGLLLKNGQNMQVMQETGGRNPVTAVGTTRDGKIVLVTIDGRQTTSVGLNAWQFGNVLLAFGVSDAVNLDGGGSAEMVVKGSIVNKPSDGAERAVGDALVWVP